MEYGAVLEPGRQSSLAAKGSGVREVILPYENEIKVSDEEVVDLALEPPAR